LCAAGFRHAKQCGSAGETSELPFAGEIMAREGQKPQKTNAQQC
jgi:hypothetical protein